MPLYCMYLYLGIAVNKHLISFGSQLRNLRLVTNLLLTPTGTCKQKEIKEKQEIKERRSKMLTKSLVFSFNQLTVLISNFGV